MSDLPPSKRTFSPALVLSALIVVVAIVMFVRNRNTPPPAAAVATVADEAPPQTQRRAPVSGMPRSPLDVKREMSERNAKSRREMQQQIERTQSAFSTRYANETVDPAWAAAKEATLDQQTVSTTIEQAGVVPENVAVDCKSTVCLVSADFGNRGDADAWFALYMNNVAAEVPYAVSQHVVNADGGITLKVYAVGRK